MKNLIFSLIIKFFHQLTVTLNKIKINIYSPKQNYYLIYY